MKVTRRRWLIALAGGGSLAAVGGWMKHDPPGRGLSVLSEAEANTMARLAEAAFPGGGAFANTLDELDMGRAFDTFLADEPEWNQVDLKRALRLLELSPIFMLGRASRFSRLPPEARLAHFQSWAEGDLLALRQASLALRRFMTMVFYDRPAVWPAIGYPGPVGG